MNKKDSLKETLVHAYHGTPVLKAEEKKKYLGTFKERVIYTLTTAELKNIEKRRKARKMLSHKEAKVLLINSKYINDLADFVGYAHEKDIGFRIVSREKRDTDVVLVVASNKAVRYP